MPQTQQAFTSQMGTLGKWSTNAPDDSDFSGDEDGYFPVSRLRQQYTDYLGAKVPEYEEQRQARHYYHGAQLTQEQLDVYRKRHQPVVIFNRVARKIDGTVGLIQRLRQDPKASPTNPKSAPGAEIATQCVRAVLQANHWKFLDPWCAGQGAVEGIAGIELKLIEGDHDDPDVGMDFVFGDDFFYDPRSAKPDFSDARYMGIAKWLDVEAAIELFPEHETELRTLMVDSGFDLTTHADREFKWIYVNEKRIRLVEHWYRSKGKWFWAFYCSNILLEQGVSPFLDERGNPICRFVMFSAAIDHDGDRYGFVRNLKGAQDELNQRRSKALHISNVSRVKVEKGAVDDVETTRREMARPDGVVEWNKGFMEPKEADQTADLQAQLALMQDARQEIDSFASITPNTLMQDGKDEHSGVAINLLQKAGIAELGSFFRNYLDWKLRVYRAAWNIIKRTWNAERFIRVTDNQGLAQFITINGMEDDKYGNPVIVNAIGELGVEIELDDGPDVANMMQDAYEVIRDDPTIPWQIKIFFMPMQDSMKKQVMSMINQPPNQLQLAQQQLGVRKLAAEVEDKQAQAQERRARSVRDAAQAANSMQDAALDGAGAWLQGLQSAATPSGGSPLTPEQPQQPPPQQGNVPPNMAAALMARTQGQQQQGAPGPMGMPIPVHGAHPILQHARMAPDGHHYVPDPRPERRGKVMRVA